jgi:nucleoside-diphosphate-sugar epimerase
VELPGHPLNRRRFWLEPVAEGAHGPAEVDGDERRPLRDWFYAPLWRQTPAPEVAADVFRGRRVVVFGGRDAAPLADRLRAAGAEAVRVEAGDAFADAGAYLAVRPAERADYAALAAALAGRGWAGETHTLHLWGLDEAEGEVGVEATGRGLERGLYSLLHWVQAQGEAGLLGEGSTLLAATRGAQGVLGTEAVRPWQATVAGLLKVVEQETAGVRCRAVDLETQWEDAVLAEAAQLAAGGVGEPEVACRGRGRWTPFHAPVPADERLDGGRVRLREGGVYLVAGGLGAVGMAMARYLAEHARAKLVLTSRRGLPPRGEWDGWAAAHGDADPASRRIAAVRELEALGAQVRVEAADVTDAAAMGALVASVQSTWGALHGVVHAAGSPSGRPVRLESPERLAGALAPRVAGALVLSAATRGVALDFVVLSSSLHAVYGGAGAMGDCASGAFLDAFAAGWSGRDGYPVVSVGWDGWRGEGGEPEASPAARFHRAADAVSPREGALAFGRILQHGFGPRVAVCTRDLPTLVERARRVAREHDHDAVAEAGRVLHPRPAGTEPYVEPRSELELTLAEMYQRALGIERIGAHDGFFELGGDSLLATHLLSALNERFRVELPLRTLFEAPTPARLAVAIVQKQAEQVDGDLLAQALAEL